VAPSARCHPTKGSTFAKVEPFVAFIVNVEIKGYGGGFASP